jgi:hypothetical protein
MGLTSYSRVKKQRSWGAFEGLGFAISKAITVLALRRRRTVVLSSVKISRERSSSSFHSEWVLSVSLTGRLLDAGRALSSWDSCWRGSELGEAAFNRR